MQLGQEMRRWGSRVRGAFGSMGESLGSFLGDVDRDSAAKWAKRIGMALLVFIVAYYPVGMIWVHRINDNLDYLPSENLASQGGSNAVAVMTALIDREINDTHWVANDPFIYPGVLLDNMPNFQMGIMGACAKFSFAMADQIGRTRGSSQADTDLQEASGLLQYPGTRWVWDLSVSLLPTASSEQQYSKARGALISYNQRLARGEAVFERRADSLLASLDRIALDIGSSSAVIDKRIESSGFLIDTQADDIFYGVKGQMYGYYLILRALRSDFKKVIEEKDLGAVYAQMVESFAHAAGLDPWVIVNGAPDGQLLPSHLASQGFYLLRARTQLREISNILLK